MSLRFEHESLKIPFQGIVVLLNLLVVYFFLTILTMQLVLLFIFEECYVVLVNLDIDIEALMTAGYFLFTKSIDANDIAGTFNTVVLSAKQHYAAMESPEPRYLYPDKNVPIDLAKQ